ncbi:MAG: alpha/beta hydrolase [Bacteroidia bacterium]
MNSIPSLLIYGEKDPVYEMGIADRIKSLMPNSSLYTIPGEGHFPHEAEGKQMAGLITDWIKQTYRNETIPSHREITSHTG